MLCCGLVWCGVVGGSCVMLCPHSGLGCELHGIGDVVVSE